MGSYQNVVFWSVLLILVCSSSSSNGDSVAEECGKEIQKVLPCLNYAQGKENTPTKDCCNAVKDMKDSDPKCLCYIMQQTHKGSDQIKSMGIQEARLLQLPSACQLQNASVSFCPKLLGISPSSPDAAIFTNVTSNSTSTSTSSTPASTTGTSAQDKSDGSNGNKHIPHLSGSLAIAIAIFIYTFSAVSTTSMF